MTGARERFGILVGVIVALLCVGLVGVWALNRPPADAPSELARAGIPVSAEDTTLNDPGVEEEREEQAEGADERVEAYEEANEHGTAGQSGKLTYAKAGTGAAPAPGGTWVGEVPIDTTADDWEPAIAADPSAPWVYVLTTRYGQAKPCPGNCPVPWISLSISRDGGATFPTTKPLCACKGSGQFDPIIEVVPGTGAVYALYMNGFNVLFTKSSDHGATWSAPVKTYGSVSWNDKPIIAVSDNGQDVYAAFNGPTGGDPWLAQSHDAGSTWTQVKLVDSNRYDFAFDGDVAPDGTVYFGESSILYGGGGNKGTTPAARSTSTSSSRATMGPPGSTRSSGKPSRAWPAPRPAARRTFYLGHHAVAADAGGNLVFLYDGATTAGGKQSIYATRSTDKGATWSTPSVVSAAGEEATLPMIESRGNGTVRAVWMETTAAATSTPGTP